MLQKFLIEEHVKSALKEDITFEDVAAENLCDGKLKAVLRTRQDGIICGLDVFKTVFKVLSDEIDVKFYFKDGDKIKKGDKIAEINGLGKAILMGERTALNYIQRMSGIATETNRYVELIKETKAKIADTRKTTPNFRIFEKYAVKTGGGSLHRFNLSDCAMIKDNHIKFAGSITNAVEKIRENISHAHKIEVECDTLKQVQEAVKCGVDIIMLDNMSLDNMKKAVQIIGNKAIIEASGNVSLASIKDIALCGVDIISSSAIVAKAPTLDLGFDM